MKWIHCIFIVLIMIMLASCSNETINAKDYISQEQLNSSIEQLQKELKRMELDLNNQMALELKKKDKEIDDLNQRISFIRDFHRSVTDDLHTQLTITDYLLNQLPDIVMKQGYIKDVIATSSRSYIYVDFANFVGDDYSPNRFHIENDQIENEKIEVANNILLYALEGAYIKSSSFEELINKHAGFYDLYFIKHKLVLIVERYIP